MFGGGSRGGVRGGVRGCNGIVCSACRVVVELARGQSRRAGDRYVSASYGGGRRNRPWMDK